MPLETNRLVFFEVFGGLTEAPCGLLCERLHLEGAAALAAFGADFYAGEPALTRHDFGQGEAYYLATAPDAASLKAILREVCARAEVSPLWREIPAQLEVTTRVSPSGETLMYLLNHSAGEMQIGLPEGEFFDLLSGKNASDSLKLDGFGVAILRKAAAA